MMKPRSLLSKVSIPSQIAAMENFIHMVFIFCRHYFLAPGYTNFPLLSIYIQYNSLTLCEFHSWGEQQGSPQSQLLISALKVDIKATISLQMILIEKSFPKSPLIRGPTFID